VLYGLKFGFGNLIGQELSEYNGDTITDSKRCSWL